MTDSPIHKQELARPACMAPVRKDKKQISLNKLMLRINAVVPELMLVTWLWVYYAQFNIKNAEKNPKKTVSS